jgi:uncharacterized Ntn-hydrolase superfamily protein
MRRGTYSIVARDPGTGELGVAVQSHWFSVGSIVSWAEPDVGAVATQSIAEPAYGPNALAALREGAGAEEALQRLLASDESADYRQVAVVDARGGVAVHTGSGCIAFAGDETGDGFSCQANMMTSATVWPAMSAAYRSAEGDIATRLLSALDAAESQGGDVRGRQSAALLVVSPGAETWRARIDLRVEDHPDPLTELRRLLTLHRAYELAERADELMGEGRSEEAGPLYERASTLAPGNDELIFWAGLAAAQSGDMETALRRVRASLDINPSWAELLRRLDEELAPGASAVREALGVAG